MRYWKSELSLGQNLDRALIHLGRLISRGPRERREPGTKCQLEAIHLEGVVLLPDRQALLEILPKNAVVAELGVDNGDFSDQIWKTTMPSCLYLVDSWESRRYSSSKFARVQERFGHLLSSDRVVIRRSRSVPALEAMAPGTLDWAYLDTDHTYATTKAELELLRTRVRPNGIIAGHDYVTGNWLGAYRYGVVEAVNEFCLEHGWRFLALTHETDRHLSFAITAIDG